MNNLDCKYLDLLNDILKNGSYKNTRSGKVISVFDRNLKFDMKEGFPLLTTKKMYVKGIIHELFWFLNGDTNIKYLIDNNVHIWDGDAYRYFKEIFEKDNEVREKYGQDSRIIPTKEEFLNAVKLKSYDVFRKINHDGTVSSELYEYGDLGDVYGKQWRHFGISGKDQITELVQKLLKNPDDRRLLCIAYNPDVVDSVALPPCHVMFQLYTRELAKEERIKIFEEECGDMGIDITEEMLNDKNIPVRELSLKWTQRSVDTFLGLPFNIASYALLLAMFAKCVNMSLGTLSCSLGDCHIYEDHLDAVKLQLERDPKKYDLPKLKINPDVFSIDGFKIDDFIISNYESYSSNKAPLCVG